MQVTRGVSFQLAGACILLFLASLAAVPFMYAEQRRRKYQERVEQYALFARVASAHRAGHRHRAGEDL